VDQLREVGRRFGEGVKSFWEKKSLVAEEDKEADIAKAVKDYTRERQGRLLKV